MRAYQQEKHCHVTGFAAAAAATAAPGIHRFDRMTTFKAIVYTMEQGVVPMGHGLF